MTKKAQETSPPDSGHKSHGKQSDFTFEAADRICANLADGKSLRWICKNVEGVPASKGTVFRWLREQPEFEKIYRIARQEGTEAHVDDMLDIADDGSNDWMENNDPDNPGYRFNGEHYGRSRLRVDTRKWIAAKMLPKKYGERIQAELTGAEGGPIQMADMSDSELARRIAFALQQSAPRVPEKTEAEDATWTEEPSASVSTTVTS